MSNISIVHVEETEMVEVKTDTGFYWNSNDWDWSWSNLQELLESLGHSVTQETIEFDEEDE